MMRFFIWRQRPVCALIRCRRRRKDLRLYTKKNLTKKIGGSRIIFMGAFARSLKWMMITSVKSRRFAWLRDGPPLLCLKTVVLRPKSNVPILRGRTNLTSQKSPILEEKKRRKSEAGYCKGS